MCKERASKYRPQANSTLIGIFVKIVKHVLAQYFLNMTHCLLRKLYMTRPHKYVFTPAAKPTPTHIPPTHHLPPIQCRDASPRVLRGSRDPRLRARVRKFSHCGLLEVCVCVWPLWPTPHLCPLGEWTVVGDDYSDKTRHRSYQLQYNSYEGPNLCKHQNFI